MRPDKLARVAERYSMGSVPGARVRGQRDHPPDSTAIIDEAGALTWSETHRRSNALALLFG
jgi:acyl-CoA synthetase (AMP-forming)/AMP-acid ligase II